MRTEIGTMKIRSREGERGSAMVEGALCFTAFLFITFGVIEFAMAIYGYNFCSYAAQDAARWASSRGANYPNPVAGTDVQAYVLNQAIALSSNITVTTAWSPDNKPGGTVQVSVQYNVVPLIGLTMPNNLQVGSTAQMLISN